MDGMSGAVASIFDTATKLVPLEDGDKEGVDENGNRVIVCGTCGEIKRMTRLFPDLRDGNKLKPIFTPRPCACGRKRAALIRARDMERKRSVLRDKAGDLSPECDFTSSERAPDLLKCWRYAKRWDDMREKNIGLLLLGKNGAGKSHAAQCIANALLDRDPPVSVYVKTFSAILAGAYDKTEILERVRQSSLVVFDDLGAERGNDYALETIFAIVNARYQTKKPTIVTTNLLWEEGIRKTSAVPRICAASAFTTALRKCASRFSSAAIRVALQSATRRRLIWRGRLGCDASARYGKEQQLMNSKLGRELSIDGAALRDMKTNFNVLLKNTIRTMREKNVEEAVITAKLDISLTASDNPNLYAPDSPEERERIIPEFKHKVTATMKIKEEAAGEVGGEQYELLWDSDVSAFVMAPIKDKGQTSLWERDAGEKPTQEITVGDVIETATAIVREANSASVALLQRRMGIQYQLASEILNTLEELGVVEPSHGSAPREVLHYDAEDGGEAS